MRKRRDASFRVVGRFVVVDPDDPWGEYARSLGRNLQAARLRAGLTQERVAMGAGISTFTYQKMENGESNPGSPANPRLQTLVSLSVVLGQDVTHLLPRLPRALEDALAARFQR